MAADIAPDVNSKMDQLGQADGIKERGEVKVRRTSTTESELLLNSKVGLRKGPTDDGMTMAATKFQLLAIKEMQSKQHTY